MYEDVRDVTRATHQALLDKGISQPMFIAILHTGVQHTAWFCRRDWLTSLPVLPHQLVECRRDATRQLHLVQLLDKHVPLNRFGYMSTVMVCHRVWPEVSLVRTLYDEGILSSHMKLRGVASQTRHTVVYSSPTTLGTNLVGTPDVGAYLLVPPAAATYHITNSSAPHTVRGVPRYTCVWEVGWKGDGVLEYFASWSPVGAP